MDCKWFKGDLRLLFWLECWCYRFAYCCWRDFSRGSLSPKRLTTILRFLTPDLIQLKKFCLAVDQKTIDTSKLPAFSNIFIERERKMWYVHIFFYRDKIIKIILTRQISCLLVSKKFSYFTESYNIRSQGILLAFKSNLQGFLSLSWNLIELKTKNIHTENCEVVY